MTLRTINDRDGKPVEIEIDDPHVPYKGYYYIHVKNTNEWCAAFFRDGYFDVTYDEEKYTPDECKIWVRL